MSTGLALALAHLKAFEENRSEVFADQVTADFHFKYLPPFMGLGPAHARRWCTLLHSLYRSWRIFVVDASEADGEVIVRAECVGADPSQADLPATHANTVVFKFTLSNGRLASSEALYGDPAGEDGEAEKNTTAEPDTGGGLDVVLAHLRAYEARTPEALAKHVGADFRYSHLPPILGVGPGHARRWFDWLHSVYRTWTLTIVDAGEADGDVVVRTEWRATDPVDADLPPAFRDSCALRYTVRNGKLVSCDAVCLDYGELPMESAA